MGLFDINDEKLQAFYHRALVEANYGFVNPRKYPYLDRAIMQYARENNCSIECQYIVLIMGCIEARNHCMFIIMIMEIRCLILITYILETSYMRNIRTYLKE